MDIGQAYECYVGAGSVAKVELQLAPEAGAKTRFTGMFAATSVGLVRVSLGRQSVASFSPGAAIKLLIDGRQVGSTTLLLCGCLMVRILS